MKVNNAVITAAGVRKRYGSTVALDGVDLNIVAGELFGLVGPDGAGKTTLLRALAGALKAEGEIALWGQPLNADNPVQKERIGYVPQQFSLYHDLTVQENLVFLGRLYGMGRKQTQNAMQPLLAWAGLEPFAHRLAGQLSGGMQKKLSLIGAILHQTKLLLLDEPTTAVDPVARKEFWQMLRDLCEEGTTVVVSTVYLDEAAECDRIALMHKGKVLAGGTPSELQRSVPFRLVEVVAEGAPRNLVQQTLQQSTPAIAQVVPYGSRFRVQLKVESGAEEEEAVREALRKAGINADVQAIPPTLEDAFVHLLERNGGAA